MKTKRIKPVFKLWDRVYYISYGWGTVVEIREDDDYGVNVQFDDLDSESFTLDGRLFVGCPPVLSFTEYTLNGLSQERPESLPEIGDVVWVRQEFPSSWVIGHFMYKSGNKYYVGNKCGVDNYLKTDFGYEITDINPYINAN